MIFGKNKKFHKQFSKMPPKIRLKFSQKLQILLTDMSNPILSKHKLHGEYDGCLSINVTGDIRALYKIVNAEVYYFVAIGTHSELYE